MLLPVLVKDCGYYFAGSIIDEFQFGVNEGCEKFGLVLEGSPKPTQYQCTPRELILRSTADWDKINRDLKTLESESLVQISKADTPLFSITSKGIEKMLALEGKTAKWNRI